MLDSVRIDVSFVWTSTILLYQGWHVKYSGLLGSTRRTLVLCRALAWPQRNGERFVPTHSLIASLTLRSVSPGFFLCSDTKRVEESECLFFCFQNYNFWSRRVTLQDAAQFQGVLDGRYRWSSFEDCGGDSCGRWGACSFTLQQNRCNFGANEDVGCRCIGMLFIGEARAYSRLHGRTVWRLSHLRACPLLNQFRCWITSQCINDNGNPCSLDFAFIDYVLVDEGTYAVMTRTQRMVAYLVEIRNNKTKTIDLTQVISSNIQEMVKGPLGSSRQLANLLLSFSHIAQRIDYIVREEEDITLNGSQFPPIQQHRMDWTLLTCSIERLGREVDLFRLSSNHMGLLQ